MSICAATMVELEGKEPRRKQGDNVPMLRHRDAK